jgi:hypothetical protein
MKIIFRKKQNTLGGYLYITKIRDILMLRKFCGLHNTEKIKIFKKDQ